VLRIWAIVLASNLAGAHLAAWTLANGHMFSSEVERALAEIGKEATAVTPALAILKGIFAGWLIAMVVWMLASARTGHIAIIFILSNWSHWAVSYFLPTLLGNVLGGVSLVSVLNHAQVVSGREK
jgi:formate-nitrite transporter family protein